MLNLKIFRFVPLRSTRVNEEEGFFSRNKIVSYSIIISCLIFVLTFAFDWAYSLRRFIPTFRGEVALGKGIVITKIHDTYPILIRANDPYFGSKLRYYGTNKYTFAHAAHVLCRPTDNVVDVGAYFGYTSIIVGLEFLKASLNGQKIGQILSYEPNERICSYFKKSLVLNDLDNIVQVKPLAVVDRIGSFSIFNGLARAPNATQKKYDPELDKEPTQLTVRCSTLDTELQDKLNFIDLLLVDVGGEAFLVIKGAFEMIEKSPNIKVLVNFNILESDEYCDSVAEFQKLIDQGLFFYLVKDGGELYEKTTPQAIMELQECAFLITKKPLGSEDTIRLTVPENAYS